MCPVSTPKCGEVTVEPVHNGGLLLRQVRDLDQGETCNYRVKATCGAPAFKAAPGGTYTSTLDHFNITWVEFEEQDITVPANIASLMPVLATKFIYQMYDITSMDTMEQSYSMDAVKNTPRKGIYSNDD